MYLLAVCIGQRAVHRVPGDKSCYIWCGPAVCHRLYRYNNVRDRSIPVIQCFICDLPSGWTGWKRSLLELIGLLAGCVALGGTRLEDFSWVSFDRSDIDVTMSVSGVYRLILLN